ncbi:MAG: flagellar biosynthesis protein FlhB [Clostridia bacterium]|nr:flagellar biosynthesis protein FlhB [Clostridia bacterium]
MKKDSNIRIDLQLFAEEEKTEKATPKKRREARSEGQVIRSNDLNSAFLLLFFFAILSLFISITADTLKEYSREIFQIGKDLDDIYTITGIRDVMLVSFKTWGVAVLPYMATAFLTGLILNYAQVGFLLTAKPLTPNLNRLNPIEGFKRIFSKKAFVELLKALVKLTAILYIVYSELLKNYQDIPNLVNLSIYDALIFIKENAVKIGIKAAAVIIAIAIFDYFFQWMEYEKSIKMTKYEVKQELKQTEGDPYIKSKIRERQREIGLKRMMQEIPKADVIITNPTHYAVALKYDPESYTAPVVVAKGKDNIARKIKEVAKSNNVSIIENKMLARELYNTVEIGSEIPPELYKAVAEILAYIYGLKNGKL